MCVIIVRPADHSLTMETLQTCARDNPDGWGFMWAQDGRVEVLRGLDWKEFFHTYENVIPANIPLAIHFRWRTHGRVNLANTHPYLVLDQIQGDASDLWVMHNGIIDIDETDPSMSDTWHWVAKMRPIFEQDPNFLRIPAAIEMLEETVQSGRLVFLNGDGDFFFLNKDSWHEAEGCFFSNQTPFASNFYNKPRFGKSRVYGFNGHHDEGDWRDWLEEANPTTPSGYVTKINGVVQQPTQLVVLGLEEEDDDRPFAGDTTSETLVVNRPVVGATSALQRIIDAGWVEFYEDLAELTLDDVHYLRIHHPDLLEGLFVDVLREAYW